MEKKDKLNYYKFLNSLPKKINKLYFGRLRGRFKLNNKSNKKNAPKKTKPKSIPYQPKYRAQKCWP